MAANPLSRAKKAATANPAFGRWMFRAWKDYERRLLRDVRNVDMAKLIGRLTDGKPLAANTPKNWKAGTVPRDFVLKKIAEVLGVVEWDGVTDEPVPLATAEKRRPHIPMAPVTSRSSRRRQADDP